jgi:hypothetical protein
MDQRSIVLYSNRKGLTAQVIHDDLVATLGEEAIAHSTVTNYLVVARIIPRDPTPFAAATSPHIDESDEAILIPLEELPFSSVRQLSRAIHLPKARYTEDSLRNSGLRRVSFDGCHISCLTIRKQNGSNVQSSF